MPDYIEQIGPFDPMSAPVTGSGVPTGTEVVLEFSNLPEDMTIVPAPEREVVRDEPQEASYLIPKRVIVRKYRLKK